MSNIEHRCGESEGCMCVYDPECNPDLKTSPIGWTIEVCQKCGKVHRGQHSSCIAEFDPAGDTFAGVERVKVVPASQLRGAVEALERTTDMLARVQDGDLHPGRNLAAEVVRAQDALHRLGGQ